MHPGTTIDNQSHLKFPPTFAYFPAHDRTPRLQLLPGFSQDYILLLLARFLVAGSLFASFVVSEVSVPICAVTEFVQGRWCPWQRWVAQLLQCRQPLCLLWWCVRFLWRFALRAVSLVGNLISCTVLVSMKVEFGVSAALSINSLPTMLEESEWYSANFGKLLIILPLIATRLLAPSLHCCLTLRRYSPIFAALSEAAVMLWLVVGPLAFAFLQREERASDVFLILGG